MAIALAAVLWASLIVSGLAHEAEIGAVSHRWIGNLLLIAVWLLVPFSLGLLIQRGANIAVAIACAVIVLGAFFLSTVTGYLGSLHSDIRSAETINRFNVLHRIVFPAISGVLLCFWIRALKPRILNRNPETTDRTNSN
jgi:hypothetical protein